MRRSKPSFDRIRAVGASMASWSSPTPYGEAGFDMAVKAARRWLQPNEVVLAAGVATSGKSSPWYDLIDGQHEMFHECFVCVTDGAFIIVPDMFRRWRAKRLDRRLVTVDNVERMRIAGLDVEVVRIRWPDGAVRLKFWNPKEAASIVDALRRGPREAHLADEP